MLLWKRAEKYFFFFWNFSGKSHCVITATNKGLKQYEKNKAGKEGRKRRWLIINVKALFTHTRTISSSFEKRMQKKHTHTFLTFLYAEWRSERINQFGNFTPQRRQYFEWCAFFFFFFKCLALMRLSWQNGDFFFCSHSVLSMMQFWFWVKTQGCFTLFSTKHQQAAHSID